MRLHQINNLIRMVFVVVIAIFLGQVTAEAATISGQVSFEGEASTPQPINFGAERQCATVHGDHMPTDESLVVNDNHTVKWVLVHVKEGLTETYDVPTEKVEIDQVGCIFKPHVTAAQVNQTVVIKNGDAVLHNVRSVSTANKPFNIAQPIQGMTTKRQFSEPEIGIELKCDVHFWMKSYLHILNHPFYAITGDDGKFTIADLPEGTYTLEAWHEKLGTQTAEVTVGGEENKTISFSFSS